MSFNYLKRYKLTFENPVETEDENLVKLNQEASILAPDADLTKTTIQGTVIENLHMEANISLDATTTSSSNNRSEIKVFNMTKEAVNRISQINGKVILEAGYEQGDYDVIFTGQVTNVHSMKNGADIVTVISCKDGWTPTSQIRYTKSFKKGVPSTEVFEDIISTFEKHGISRSDTGILLDEVNSPWVVPSETTIQKSWSYSGFLRGALDKLCQEFGLTYQIEHSTLFIYPKNFKEMFTEVVLTEEQIMSIKRAAKSNNKTSNSSSQNRGIEVTTLLIPKLTTKYRVKVKSVSTNNSEGFNIKDYEGEYKITSMSHKLSYEGNGWNTILSCEELTTEES